MKIVSLTFKHLHCYVCNAIEKYVPIYNFAFLKENLLNKKGMTIKIAYIL